MVDALATPQANKREAARLRETLAMLQSAMYMSGLIR